MDGKVDQTPQLVLPFEMFVRRRLLKERLFNIAPWFSGIAAGWLLIVWAIERRGLGSVLADYGVSVFLGASAGAMNVLSLLRQSRHCRALRPYLEGLVHGEEVVAELYAKTFFGRRIIWTCIILFTALGYFTFGILGLDAPRGTVVAIYIPLFFVFGLLGMSIGFAVNIWRAIFRLGRMSIEIEPLHMDGMGGLKPIGDLNLGILYYAAPLVAIYSLGCHFAPYERPELRSYAYLWIAFAIILYVPALFLPMYGIHRLLKKSRRHYEECVSGLKRHVLRLFEQCASEDRLDWDVLGRIHWSVEALKYIESQVQAMATWPYERVGRTIVGLGLLQAAVWIWTQFPQIMAFAQELCR